MSDRPPSAGHVPSHPPSTGSAASVAFVCCVERGALEPQTILLARSIRRFAGGLADAPVFAFSPRPDRQPAAETLRSLADLDVTHVAKPLNVRFPDYGMANKFAAGLWAEEHAGADVVVFVDSDTIFVTEPVSLRLAEGIDLALRPADRKDKGSTGPGDEREPYWERLYALTGVAGRPWVETPVDHQHIRGYFNGGLVAARRSSGLFSAWFEDFLTLERAGHLPPEGIGFMDMLSLAATGARAWERTSLLDWRYDYPLPLRPVLSEPARSAAIESLVHVHYHRWFARPGFLDALVPPLDPDSALMRWLRPFLPFQPTIGGRPPAWKPLGLRIPAAPTTAAAPRAGRPRTARPGQLRRGLTRILGRVGAPPR